jgi:hypothetical protein
VIPPEQNAEFVCAMEDVLEVYQRPHDPLRPVICVDETCKQLVSETRRRIAAGPGQLERFDYEYERQGTANVFMAAEPLMGTRWTKVTERRTAVDFAQFVKDLDRWYPAAQKLVLVMDNLNTHKPASLYEAFEPEEARRLTERLEIHYTPKHGSWLNIAEIELSVLSRQCLDRRIGSIEELRKDVAAWQGARNRAKGRIDWQFKTADARVKLKRLYPSIELR